MSPALPLLLFAFYAAALDLGAGIGFIGALAMPPGWILLGAAAALSAVAAVRAVRRKGPLAPRLAAVLAGTGAALALAGLPASLLLRDAQTLVLGEGHELPPGVLPGAGEIQVGAVTVAPRGPSFLSKTVAVEVEEDGRPATIGLFPPASLAGWRLSVVRYGFAPRVVLADASGRPSFDAFVPLGQLAPRPQDAALVSWTPEPNVMMGAGTYPPKLEDLLSPRGTALHVFVRLDAATLGGARRDLRDPDAWRWLADGRPEDPLFHVEVLRGKEKVFAGEIPAGSAGAFPGGAVELGREVRMWVELVAVHDPWLPVAAVGLALLVAGLLVQAVRLAGGAARRLTARAAADRR